MRKWLSYASSSNWLRVVGVATIVLLASYLMVQQSIRLGANDAPQAAAQTARSLLESGKAPKDVIPQVKTNLASDNTVFVTITEQNQNILASSVDWSSQTPILPPPGTFTSTSQKGDDWFTWQPTSQIRQAVEMLPYSGAKQSGFVIAGQSLKQPESRVNRMGWIMLVAWLAVVVWATLIPMPGIRK